MFDSRKRNKLDDPLAALTTMTGSPRVQSSSSVLACQCWSSHISSVCLFALRNSPSGPSIWQTTETRRHTVWAHDSPSLAASGRYGPTILPVYGGDLSSTSHLCVYRAGPCPSVFGWRPLTTEYNVRVPCAMTEYNVRVPCAMTEYNVRVPCAMTEYNVLDSSWHSTRIIVAPYIFTYITLFGLYLVYHHFYDKESTLQLAFSANYSSK
ncbi:hypothetical protein J6590_003404 [Homalodisca vitripennis]|nr:hypothetical protein J6590_003404 [Homalodisca vitripennis]